MTERPDPRPTPIGIYGRSTRDGISVAEVIAIVVSILWLIGAAVFFLVLGGGREGGAEAYDPLTFVMVLMAIFLPVAMFWVAATAARSGRVIREESRRLQVAIDAIRESYLAEVQKGQGRAGDASIARKLDEIAAAQRKTETTLATFHSTRTNDPATRELVQATPPRIEDEQAALPLVHDPEPEATPLPRATVVRALNFPETAEDEEGFAALRHALKDRSTANLIQAAQDVLTLLSQDGIYMDDLRPDMSRPELWRRFAEGERGRAIAALGGIRDRSSLALTAGRMRQDPIFREAAHDFLRRYDQMVVDFVTEATDQEVSSLAETRTARAFMLLGRVAGVFN